MKIMVVDDEAPIRRWFSSTIQKLSDEYQVTGSYALAKEALAAIQEDIPDVVITDIRMPGMDGIELMKYVRQRWPEIEFVILTNYAEFSYAKQAVAYGAVQYFLKSEVSESEIRDVLHKISTGMEYKKQGNRAYLAPEVNERDWQQTAKGWGMERDAICAVFAFRNFGGNIRQLLDQASALYENARTFRNQGILFLFMWNNQGSMIGYGRMTELAACVREKEKQSDLSVGIAIGPGNIQSAWQVIKQAKHALAYRFFKPDAGVYRYDQLKRQGTCRIEEIRKEYRGVLECMACWSYRKLREKTDLFLKKAGLIQPDEIEGSIDICKRLTLLLEEKGFQKNPDNSAQVDLSTRELDDIGECRQLCMDFIALMEEADAPSNIKAVREAVRYIQDHYREDISLSDMAKLSCLSPEYFCRLFKEETKETFGVYLMSYRLKRARELLRTTDMKINAVAAQVGYSTAGYFSKIYKKYFGITTEQEKIKK